MLHMCVCVCVYPSMHVHMFVYVSLCVECVSSSLQANNIQYRCTAYKVSILTVGISVEAYNNECVVYIKLLMPAWSSY